MKKWNKVLAGLLAASMVWALAGCGSDSADDAAETTAAVETAEEESTEEAAAEEEAAEGTETTEEAETAEESEETAEEKPTYDYEVGDAIKEIQDRGYLIVGIDSGYVPFCFTDPATGDSYGVNVEVAKRVAEVLGVDIEIVSETFSAVLSDLAVDKIDLVAAMVINTEERAEIMQFSDSMRQGYDYILVRTEDADKYTDKASLEGAIVTANNGSVQLTHAQELAEEGINVNVVASESVADSVLQVVSGTADVVVVSDANGLVYEMGYEGELTLVKTVNWENDTASLAVNIGDDDLLDVVNQIINNEVVPNVDELIEEQTRVGVSLLGVGK
ncbi:MAG: amino acid ABC transporter substrate-binding protein [Lachnospiraceae bacterium]|nr:amino acid ABC transporter substrate-binding protein [Lachnospiraceae bacterium]